MIQMLSEVQKDVSANQTEVQKDVKNVCQVFVDIMCQVSWLRVIFSATGYFFLVAMGNFLVS